MLNSFRWFKVFPALIGFATLLLPGPASARNPVLQYKFAAGTTNVYQVKIIVQGENGQDITSGNVFLAITGVSSNMATLSMRSSLRTETKSGFQPGMGFYGGRMMRGMPGFPRTSEMVLDVHGHLLRNGGDYALPAPLGELLQVIFAPLPEKPVAAIETKDEVLVVDAPLLLGPVKFWAAPQGFGPGSYMGFDQRNSPATLALARHTTWQVAASTAAVVTLKTQTTLQSYLQTGSEPSLLASSTATWEFNVAEGCFQKIEVSADLTSATESTSRKSKITATFQRLTGTELAEAVKPPAPPAPKKLSAEDLQKIMTDLKSSDSFTRQNALSSLNAATVDSPSPELLKLVTESLAGADSYPRMQAMNFLAGHAGKEQVPDLIKMLKDSDFSIRQNAIHSLVRLHDERAIEPLADYVARGGAFNQEAASALISMGPAAEKTVLLLLNERQTDTRRQACTILQQIGTKDSIEPLEKLAGDPDQSLGQAATEALRAVNARQ